jgi:isoquinoline 1-oxidoreductase beta subunit
MQEIGVPVGFWRSVGNSQNGFFIESFIDELAHAAGKDPVDMRRALLNERSRHRALLEKLVEAAGWGKAEAGRVQGIALHESFGSIAGQVMEATVAANGEITMHKVTCVVDCGTMVNPDTIKAQMDSSIVYGLTAAYFGEITIRDGAAEQGNFDTYQMLKLAHMPAVETHIIESGEKLGGIGEPATPPAAPALANAIFAATGKRIRSLPLSKHGFMPV